jgi:hypothetical protein
VLREILNTAGDALDAPGTGHAGAVSPVQLPLAGLKRRRDELRGEYSQLDASRARLAEAGERQKAATKAIAAIGEAESAEMSAWALAGSVGPVRGAAFHMKVRAQQPVGPRQLFGGATIVHHGV